MKIQELSVDLETYSDVDIARCGVYKYAESDNFEILLFGVSVDGGDVVVYDLACGDTIPKEILDTLTLKIEEVEALIDEVSDIAYDKAVEVVTDEVRVETHKEDIRLVEQSKAWVLSPERKASQKERTYAVSRLDGVITKITKAMQTAVKTIQTTLIKPEVKKVNTEQIKKKARSSILDRLAKAKITAEQENRERWEHEGRTKLGRNDMEL